MHINKFVWKRGVIILVENWFSLMKFCFKIEITVFWNFTEKNIKIPSNGKKKKSFNET